MSKRIFFLLTLSLIFFVSYAPLASAQTTLTCQPIFGGGQSCIQSKELNLDISVKNPNTGNYVDNLRSNEPEYLPGRAVPFKLTLKNMTNKPISNITVKNIFPQYVNFLTGDARFDAKNKSLPFSIDRLNANETKDLFFSGQILTTDKLPGSFNTLCLTDQAIATFGNNEISRDNSQFCVTNTQANTALASSAKQQNPSTTKGGLPVYEPAQTKSTPKTGSEAFSLFALIPLGGVGIFLRRKTFALH